MKLPYRYNAILITLMLIGPGFVVLGQNRPQPAYFRFANAAGISEKLSLTIDAHKLKPQGFAPGDTTGSIGILPGSHQFTISSTDAGVATATPAIQPNASTTMIAYCKVVVDPRTNVLKKTLQLLQRMNPPKDGGRHFQLLYVSSKPTADIVLNGTPVRIASMREVKGAELPGGDIKVEQAGKSVVQFTAPQAGNFLAILYDAPAGNVAGFVASRLQVAKPPLRRDDSSALVFN